MNRLLAVLLWIMITSAAPLAGAVLFGRWNKRLLSIPPLQLPIDHAPLSWPVFAALAFIIGASLLPFISRVIDMRSARPRRLGPTHSAPILKGLCWLLLAICWLVAWTRLPVFSRAQLHTFAPLWLAYIALMSIKVYERSGSAAAIRQPLLFSLLFPASAVMWWVFEWLNRFVENWRYENVSSFSASEYVVLATAAFATVLPAMLVTKEFIGELNPFERAFKHWVCISIPGSIRMGLVGTGSASLCLVPAFPNELFPLLWISPLLILIGLCPEEEAPSTLRRLRIGDWRSLIHWCLAGLWCGVLWELWNFGSLARWIYEIPYVGAVRIFEMPILGFAGYLPFGLLCGLLTELLTERVTSRYPSPEQHSSVSESDGIDILT